MNNSKKYLSKPVKIKLRGSDEEMEGNFIFTDSINAFGVFKCPVNAFIFIPKDDPATEKVFEFWNVEMVWYVGSFTAAQCEAVCTSVLLAEV